MENKWIPVSERVPDVGKSVLVTVVIPDGQRECYVSEWIYNKWSGVCGFEVSAWMPLPEPYRKDDENES